jgi:hypothetical protein
MALVREAQSCRIEFRGPDIEQKSENGAKMISGEEAISKIEGEFPELVVVLHDEINEGLLHLQVAEFSRVAQKAIDDGDKAKLAKIYVLFKFLFLNGSPELINALNVSFLEHLNVSDGKKKRAWAYAAMPPLMKKAFDEMAEYNRRIHGA